MRPSRDGNQVSGATEAPAYAGLPAYPEHRGRAVPRAGRFGMSEKDGTERPEPIVYVGPPVTTVGADPNEEQTRAVGFGNPWQC